MKENVFIGECLIENEIDQATSETMYEILNELNHLVDAVKRNPAELADELERLRDDFKQVVVRHGICPECGGEIKTEEKNLGYTEIVCQSCGYRE